MEQKIVFLDVDGTLTLPNGEVSDNVKKSIQQVRQNGHYVFLCTGRNKAGVQSLMPIGFDGIICSAGGYIEYNGKKIYESCLKEEDVKEAREVFDRNGIMYNLETTHMTFQNDDMNEAFIKIHLKDDDMNSELTRLLNEQKDRFNIHSIEEYEAHPLPVQKLCFMTYSEESLKEPRTILSKKYNFIVHEFLSTHIINGEIIIKGTNKGNAVRFVVEHLGLSMKNTICFGDSMNDLEMIEVCEHSVVLGNGSEVLKSFATTVCESVHDDGVYHEMKRLGLCS